ncbi:MAG TPA: hypothetical protein PKA55_05585 [Rhodoblastus sp.]|nr:hypothetical protein [Rhodoblastus sp.]
MKKTFLLLAALSAFSGAARADVCGGDANAVISAPRPADNACRVDGRFAGEGRSPARVELAQYYERGDGYGGGYGGGPFRYCRTWAQGMVLIGAEAARRGCLQYGPQGLHTNYDAHFQWCMSTSPGRTQRAAARANALLASCNR